MVGASGKLALQVDPAKRIGREILDSVTENLGIPQQCMDIVRRVNGRVKKPHLLYRHAYPPGGYKISHMERSQNDRKDAGRKVGQ